MKAVLETLYKWCGALHFGRVRTYSGVWERDLGTTAGYHYFAKSGGTHGGTARITYNQYGYPWNPRVTSFASTAESWSSNNCYGTIRIEYTGVTMLKFDGVSIL